MSEEPVGGAWIEVIQFFPVEGVTGTVIEVEFCAGDGGGDFFTHPLWGEGILFATDDEGGAVDVFEVVDGVVSDGGLGLGFHGVDGLGGGVDGGVLEALLHVGPAVIIIKPGFAEDEHLHVVHEVFRAHAGFAIHEVLPGVEAKAVLPSPGAHEDHAFDFFRVPEGKLLGDGAAEGAADDAGLLDAEAVHEAGVVVRHHGGGVGAFRFVCEADAAVVSQDAAEVLFPDFCMGIPDAAGGGDSHDADQGVSATAFFIIHLNSVGGDVRHGGLRFEI